jgi:hypothetical protein
MFCQLREPILAESLARDLGDPWRLSQVLERQSYRALFVTGDLKGVLSAHEGRELARHLGDQLTAHQCGIYIAGARLYIGDLAGALDQARAVKADARTSGDLLSEMTGLMSESIVLSMMGDADGALVAIAAAYEASRTSATQ